MWPCRNSKRSVDTVLLHRIMLMDNLGNPQIKCSSMFKVPVPKHISMPTPVSQAEPPAPTPIVFTEPPAPQQQAPQQQIPARREEVEEPMEQEETAQSTLEDSSEEALQVKSYHHHHRPVQECIAWLTNDFNFKQMEVSEEVSQSSSITEQTDEPIEESTAKPVDVDTQPEEESEDADAEAEESSVD